QTGFPDTTIFAALDRAGVSNRYFFNDVPVSALWGAPGLARAGSIAEYYARCAAGTLPHVSYVDPNFAGSVGEGPGLSGDEHPDDRRLPVGTARPRRPHDVRVRVDPEDDRVPLRAQAPDQARHLRPQHRDVLRLEVEAPAPRARPAAPRARGEPAVPGQRRR